VKIPSETRSLRLATIGAAGRGNEAAQRSFVLSNYPQVSLYSDLVLRYYFDYTVEITVSVPAPETVHATRRHMPIFPEFIVKPFRPYLRAILAVQGSASLANTVLYSMYRESLLSCERNRDPKRLLKYGFRAYSQHDEDGMIHEIFRRIGVSNQTFLEFGVGDGTENNTLIFCSPVGGAYG
jgi:hypothetical protein